MSSQFEQKKQNTQPVKRNRRSLWGNARRWLPGVLISVVALLAVFKFSGGIDDIGAAFGKIKPIYILACLLMTPVFLFIRAEGWRILLGGKATYSQSFWVICQGYLLNNIFPFRAGELARAVFMGRLAGLNPFYVLSTIVIERAFDLAMAAGLLLSTLPFVLGAEWARQAAWITLLIVVAGFVLLYLMGRYPGRVEVIAHKVAGKWKIGQKFILPQLGHLLRGLSILSKPSQFIRAVFFIVLSWAAAILTYYILLGAVAPKAPFWWAIFADAMLAAGIAVPSAPGALGVFEATLVFALSLLGIQEALGLAYAVTLHFTQILVTGVLGMIGLAKQGRSFSKISEDLQVEMPSPERTPGEDSEL